MKSSKKSGGGQLSQAESAASSAVKMACDIGSKAIIVLSESGETARLLAKFHPSAKIIAVCVDPRVARQIEGYMCNTIAIVAEMKRGDGAHVRYAFGEGKARGIFAEGDLWLSSIPCATSTTRSSGLCASST